VKAARTVATGGMGKHSLAVRPVPTHSGGGTDQRRLCGIDRESGDQQALLQEATDGLDPTRGAPAPADPHAGVKWGLGSDVPGVVSGVPCYPSTGGGVTP
jgi:hypothetical protein